MNNVRNNFFLTGAILMLGFVIMAGAWTDAPLNPPANNVAAPINVGDIFQIKEGGLQLRGLFVEGKGVFSTSTYSMPSNVTLAINGAVAANAYCDVNGQNCKSAADIGTAVTGGAGGKKIVCGGWDSKYGAGTVDGSQWGCVSAGTTSCPAGYDAVSTSHVTINLAEHTNLCVLSSAGASGSSDQAIPGWPNTIICNATNGVKVVLPLSGYYSQGRTRYSSNPGYMYGDIGGVISIYFDAATKKSLIVHGNGDYGGNINVDYPGCVGIGVSITDPVFTWK